MALTSVSSVYSGPAGYNYVEEAVPPYQLPDPLKKADGSVVDSPAAWAAQRKHWLLLIEREMFGKAPARPTVNATETEPPTPALEGKAIRQQVRISFAPGGPGMDLLLYRPAGATKPVAVVFGLNFNGNQSAHKDPAIKLCQSWLRDSAKEGITGNRATDAARGLEAERWQVEYAVSRGYAVATVCYADIDPDFDDGWKNGVHALFPEVEKSTPRDPSAWGSIAAWAWGMSLGMDWLEQQPALDRKRVICQGHSRLGKTALWAGAMDERFAMVISHDSGAGGAALSKRIFGETVGRLNTSFPHWFCGNFKKYSEKETDLPFDAHTLLSLIAPRPLLITSATEDLWADPRGEFLGGLHASPVYKLMGTDGLSASEMPPADHLVSSRIGYFLRTGKHDVTRADWQAYLDFADAQLKP